MIRSDLNSVSEFGLLDPENKIGAPQNVLRNLADLRVMCVLKQALKNILA